MIREWETGGQKPVQQRPRDPRAQERRLTRNGALATGESSQHRDPPCCLGGWRQASPLGTWSKLHPSDLSIAPGKYSPLEKEIMHLGGVHTAASRRLLAHEQEEERKALKALRLQSADCRQEAEYRRQHFPACATCGLLEKIWTAKAVVAPRELPMPRREQRTISKHVQRMQLARAQRTARALPDIERGRGAAALPGDGPRGGGDAAREDGEDRASNRQEIKMNVVFKSKEPKPRFTYQPSDLKPFFPPKRGERSIAGLTNRNLLRLAEFPGDLMLMNQDFISRGIHSRDGADAARPRGERVWKERWGKPASHPH